MTFVPINPATPLRKSRAKEGLPSLPTTAILLTLFRVPTASFGSSGVLLASAFPGIRIRSGANGSIDYPEGRFVRSPGTPATHRNAEDCQWADTMTPPCHYM